MLGNALGDAMGAHTEFSQFNANGKNILKAGWDDYLEYGDLKTPMGMVTDDFSMARCMADSLICNDSRFNGIDLRVRFLLWWHFGYNNTHTNYLSFGLGGNI